MPRYAIIDDTDPGLVYTGDWQLLTNPVYSKAPEYSGTTHVTNDPTATVTYKFYGTSNCLLAHALFRLTSWIDRRRIGSIRNN